jgi:hypothetical protein
VKRDRAVAVVVEVEAMAAVAAAAAVMAEGATAAVVAADAAMAANGADVKRSPRRIFESAWVQPRRFFAGAKSWLEAPAASESPVR